MAPLLPRAFRYEHSVFTSLVHVESATLPAGAATGYSSRQSSNFDLGLIALSSAFGITSCAMSRRSRRRGAPLSPSPVAAGALAHPNLKMFSLVAWRDPSPGTTNLHSLALLTVCIATMSDGEAEVEAGDQKLFYVDRAKGARAGCKKCKDKIESGTLRLAKVLPNPFGDGTMKHWFHVPCIFEAFTRQRATTPKITSTEDIGGWVENLSHQDRLEIIAQFPDYVKVESNPAGGPIKAEPKKRAKKKVDDDDEGSSTSATPTPKQATPKKATPKKAHGELSQMQTQVSSDDKPSKDDLFREFRRLCADVANESSYLKKTEIIQKMFTKGADGSGFKGDLLLWCRLLLPGVGTVKRVYNLQSKQLIKLFSRLFGADQDEMLEDLEQGDIAETIKNFFDRSQKLKPAKKSLLTLQDVDNFLERLTMLTKEEDQMAHFKQIAVKCTSNDLKMVIRLIKGDLRINAGAKPILTAIHEDAYQAFQANQDIEAVVKEALKHGRSANASSLSPKKKMNIGVNLLTPVLPMLAEACKSVEMAMKKCPNGMYSEIKYDGERVQVHKQGNQFKYFSRSLKPVLPHKVNHFKDHIPKAFPHGKDLILDAEVLMIDLKDGKPLPFGSLGVHKRNDYADANVCLFVFDCMYLNGESLLDKPIKERKRILKDNMIEIPNHIVFSEMEEIHEPKELENMISKVLKQGLEGLVLKDLNSTYEPGKRHWLKVKKDYLFGGKMADSADLLVLGAWYGSGQKGGMMSIFLMGCRDPEKNVWCTVSKCHTGHDDKTLERLQTELAPNMQKISKDATKVPKWLKCTKTMVPDFVAIDPELQPVWEITGAEFTQHDVHTADGISIRFPRCTRIRTDKNWETATTLPELKTLFENSKTNFSDHLFGGNCAGDASNPSSPVPCDDESREAVTPTKSPKIMTVNKSPKGSEKLTPLKASPKGSKQKKKQDSDASPKKNPTLDNFLFRKRAGEDTKTDLGDQGASSSNIVAPSPKKPKLDFDAQGRKDKYLVDVFAGVKMELPKRDIADYETLYRYFVAYGGVVLHPSTAKEDRTHVLSTPSTKAKGLSVPLVQVSWLWDSIKLQKLQDPINYLVY
nr:PREDICTED: DNA ligase 3 isoform X2 [Bemisia tabaci]